MNKKLFFAVALLGVGVLLLLMNLRRGSLDRYRAHKQWPMECIHCKGACTLTSEEQDAMIKRGDVITEPHQERLFKCRHCGKIGLASPSLRFNEVTNGQSQATP